MRDEGFNVKHLHRDLRGDWGDDGGYIISVSEKSNEIYVHFLEVNYNWDVYMHCLEGMEENKIKKHNFPDYFYANSIEHAQEIINEFVYDLEKLKEMDFDGRKAEDLDSYKGFDHLVYRYKHFLAIAYSAYSEYEQDKEVLLNLTNIPYKPDYSDPIEYIENEGD